MAGYSQRATRALGGMVRTVTLLLAGCLSLPSGASWAQSSVAPAPNSSSVSKPSGSSSKPAPTNLSSPGPAPANNPAPSRSFSTPTKRDFGYYNHNFEMLDVDKAARSHGVSGLTRPQTPATLVPQTDMRTTVPEEPTSIEGANTPQAAHAETASIQALGVPRKTEFTYWDGSVMTGRILSFDGKTYVIGLPFGQTSVSADKFAQVKTLPLSVPGLTSKQLAANPLVKRSVRSMVAPRSSSKAKQGIGKKSNQGVPRSVQSVRKP